MFFCMLQWSSVWLMSALEREPGSLSSSEARILSKLLRWRLAWMYLIMLQNVPQGWSREQGHCLIFFFLPLFASRTQLPHLTFSIWPLPRGEMARVSREAATHHEFFFHLTCTVLFTLVMHMDQEWRYCSIKGIFKSATQVLQWLSFSVLEL